MERLLAEANQVADDADKPDILDAIVSAMLRTVHIGMRVKTSYFPAVWNNATADAIKGVQEMMFVRLNHCITAMCVDGPCSFGFPCSASPSTAEASSF